MTLSPSVYRKRCFFTIMIEVETSGNMNFPLILCAVVLSVPRVATNYQNSQNEQKQFVFTCGSPDINDINQKLDSMERQLTSLQSNAGGLRNINCKIDPMQELIKSLQSKVDALTKALVFKHGKSSGDKIFVTNSQEANYEDAYTTCSAAGGLLVSPKNIEENKAVLDLALQSKKRPFLGITDHNREGEFAYPDGEAIKYTNWAPNEPNDENGKEDCVEMYEDGKWNDKNCQERRLVICEFF
uniref:C-type lectin domain-containing protein n=1 Tax=Leptobrachium leishanense TaxID=445787 RepID=A0A8C5MZC1_9ANUR